MGLRGGSVCCRPLGIAGKHRHLISGIGECISQGRAEAWTGADDRHALAERCHCTAFCERDAANASILVCASARLTAPFIINRSAAMNETFSIPRSEEHTSELQSIMRN